MKKTVLAAALIGGAAMPLLAFAQTTPAPSSSGDKPAVITPNSQNPTAPVKGANSFTEAQAKSRIETAGYTGVRNLKLDDKGVWIASGMKDGKSATIALDYQGNIVTN